jgi:hypothetical protein
MTALPAVRGGFCISPEPRFGAQRASGTAQPGGARSDEGSVNPVGRPLTVNAGVVNADPPIFCPQHFCEFFPAFATNPRFQNPFKYNCKSKVNGQTAYPAR